jgi:hypothetical protein
MLDSVIVVGVVALLIAILQKSVAYFETEVGQMWLKLLMLLLAGLFNVANGLGFSGDAISVQVIMGYFKDGLILGAAASGIYGMGKELTDSVKQVRLTSGKFTKAEDTIPAHKSAINTMLVGCALILLSPVGWYFALCGAIVVMVGYFIGAVSATRYYRGLR